MRVDPARATDQQLPDRRPAENLQSSIDPLKDAADWVELLAKPKESNSILARGKADNELGELVRIEASRMKSGVASQNSLQPVKCFESLDKPTKK